MFLDTRNRLIADEVQGRGTVNHTPAYPREVVKRALKLQATAIILARNHPSGDPSPSADDIAMTRDVQEAAGTSISCCATTSSSANPAPQFSPGRVDGVRCG